MERVKGIEPSSSAWKAVALPLSYTRIALVRIAENRSDLTLRAPTRRITLPNQSSCTLARSAELRFGPWSDARALTEQLERRQRCSIPPINL
jgi:hypothetical protein